MGNKLINLAMTGLIVSAVLLVPVKLSYEIRGKQRGITVKLHKGGLLELAQATLRTEKPSACANAIPKEAENA